jgi:Na+/citrate or Na+/malate symporter
MRQPPAERVRFFLVLKMLGLLLARTGERLRVLAHRLAGAVVGLSHFGS